MKKTYQLSTLNDTKLLAKAISKIASKNFYVLLKGPLGSGKTQLTKFIGQELAVAKIINSPTFIILNEYQTKHPWKLVHIDAYRLSTNEDFGSYFEHTVNNFTIIEWPQQIKWNFKKNKRIIITFIFLANIRKITVETYNLNLVTEKQFFFNLDTYLCQPTHK